MMRGIALVAACALVALSCQKKPAEPASGTPPADAAAPPAAAAAPSSPAAPAEAAPVEITEAMVAKYVEYEKEQIRLANEFAERSRKALAASQGSAAKTLQTVALSDEMSKELDAKLAATRQALGLSDEAFEAVRDAAGILANGRMLYVQMGGDAQLAQMIAEQKKQIAALPADQREVAEAEMAKVSRSLEDMRDGADVRKKYGDKSAEAMLKFADVLARQRLDALKTVSGKQ